MPNNLLTARQMAQFVAEGFLVFPAIVPEVLNAEANAELATDAFDDNGYRGERFSERYRGLAMDRVFRQPAIAGMIESLVGVDPIFDHHARHVLGPHSGSGSWHQDAVIDAKQHFDIELLYFPHDTPKEMGGTMLLPGSHFRRVNVFEVIRYKNFIGQVQTICPAGTIVAVHHGIWHTSQPNLSDRQRMMFKVRLAARVPQVRLFDTSLIDDPDVRSILGREHMWPGTDSRLEIIHRIELWRRITGNPHFDLAYYLGRLENNPDVAVPWAARDWQVSELASTASR